MPRGGNKLDLTGKKFNRLTALRIVGRTKSKNVVWECECECGNLTTVVATDLKSGHTKSCGCLQIEKVIETGHKNKGEQGQEGLTCLYAIYKYQAKRKNIPFLLTKIQFKNLTQQPCFYCGHSPSNQNKGMRRGDYEIYIYSGLDRIDNSKGYTEENVVPCCKRCNVAKNNQTLQEFFDQVKSIYEIHELWKS